MSGRLTTHVLDLVTGKPAAGLTIELWRYDDSAAPLLVKQVITNSDGRVDAPLLQESALSCGIYELRFQAGAYWRARGEQRGGDQTGAGPGFLDVIPIRFGIADPAQHYHVPLLLSNFGYSTYRGS